MELHYCRPVTRYMHTVAISGWSVPLHRMLTFWEESCHVNSGFNTLLNLNFAHCNLLLILIFDHYESHESYHFESLHYSCMHDESGLIAINLTNVVQYFTCHVLQLWSLYPMYGFRSYRELYSILYSTRGKLDKIINSYRSQ